MQKMESFLWVLLVALIACTLMVPLQDPDLWFHIVAGRWILGHQEFPSQDYWNLFGLGRPWQAYSWSSQILFALAERIHGFQGLFLLYAAITSAVIFSSAYVLGRLSGSYAIGFLLTALTGFSWQWFLVLRPQCIAWLVLFWVLYVCERLREEGWSWSRTLQLALCMCLWANTHVSTIIGIAAIVLWLSAEPLSLLIKAAGIAFLATLMTPYIGGEWITALKLAGHPLRFDLIAELRPSTIRDPFLWPLLLVAAGVFVSYYRRSENLSLRPVVAWLVFLIGALHATKFIPFALIVTVALFARAIPAADRVVLRGWRERYHRVLGAVLVPVILLWGAHVGPRLLVYYQHPLNSSGAAIDAVDFIEEKNLPRPILNSFNEGNYLIYHYSDQSGNPRVLVPLDGRPEVYGPKVWENYKRAFNGAQGWDELLKRTNPKTVLWPTASPFVRLLLASKRWCLVYQDEEYQGSSVLISREVWNARKAEFLEQSCGEEPVSTLVR